eukprot:1183390-Prorocentrum_minimum.AAC.3
MVSAEVKEAVDRVKSQKSTHKEGNLYIYTKSSSSYIYCSSRPLNWIAHLHLPLSGLRLRPLFCPQRLATLTPHRPRPLLRSFGEFLFQQRGVQRDLRRGGQRAGVH